MAVAAMVAATAFTALGQMQEGHAAEAAGDLSALQNRRNAKASYAKGINESNEIRRQGDVMASNASAAIAGGGGVTDDVGSIKTLSDIEQVTDYNALTALYSGKQRQDTQNFQAKVDRYAGQAAKAASDMKAVGTVISGGSNAYQMSTT